MPLRDVTTWMNWPLQIMAFTGVLITGLKDRIRPAPPLTPRQQALKAWSDARQALGAKPEIAALHGDEQERAIILELFRQATAGTLPKRPKRNSVEEYDLVFEDWKKIRTKVVDDVISHFVGWSEKDFYGSLRYFDR